MKQTATLLAALLILAACSKSSDLDQISQRAGSLSNNAASSIGKWQLQGLTLGIVSQPLTGTQTNFVKVYQANGQFFDSDGLKGTWKLPTEDSLIEYYSNFSAGVLVEQKYRINILSASQLNLTYVVNGMEITTNYKAIP